MASEGNKFQFSLSTMRWFDAAGGHIEDDGVTQDRTVIKVPHHQHHVNLNIYRTDIGLKYQFARRSKVEVNIPFEVKIQEASVEKIEGETYSSEEWEAIELNGYIHHRNETYSGPADGDFLIGYSMNGFFGDFIMGRIGTTIPLGKTEDDPWKLGEAGLEHLHIQFGTGTFNPIADLHYSFPIYKRIAAHSSIRCKFPFYENSKTYRGSRELTYTAGLNFRADDWISLNAGYLGFYQAYAYWDGEIDKNTGLRFGMASMGASFSTPFNVPLSIALMLPLHQETLYDDEEAFLGGRYEEIDAFKFGPLISLTVLYSF